MDNNTPQSSQSNTEQLVPQSENVPVPKNIIQSQPNSVSTPPIISGNDNSTDQQPFVMYGQGDIEKEKQNHHKKRNTFILIASLSLFLIGVSLYIIILPIIWASTYTKNIKTQYNTQSTKITLVYNLFNDPSSNVTTQQSYNNLNDTINTAISNTSNLKTKNKLTILPGTKWLSSVSNANKQYLAMQKYIADSQTFLINYKTLISYAWQFDQDFNIQFPILINNLKTINKGAPTSVFVADLQTAATDDQTFIAELNKLNAPADLKNFNNNIISDISIINSALSTQLSEIQTNNISDFANQKILYINALNDFTKLLATNPVANIRTSSTISNQLSQLEKDHPIN